MNVEVIIVGVVLLVVLCYILYRLGSTERVSKEDDHVCCMAESKGSPITKIYEQPVRSQASEVYVQPAPPVVEVAPKKRRPRKEKAEAVVAVAPVVEKTRRPRKPKATPAQ